MRTRRTAAILAGLCLFAAVLAAVVYISATSPRGQDGARSTTRHSWEEYKVSQVAAPGGPAIRSTATTEASAKAAQSGIEAVGPRKDAGCEILGTVQYSSGIPAPGVTVLCFPDHSQVDTPNPGVHRREEMAASATSGADGHFVLLHLDPGKYRLACYDRNDMVEVDVALSEPGAHAEPNVVLRRKADLLVSVAARDGSGLASVEVRVCFPKAARHGDWPDNYSPRSVGTTDAAGNCLFQGLPPGEMVIWLKKTGFQIARFSGIPVSEGESARVHLEMATAPVIKGKIRLKMPEAALPLLRPAIYVRYVGQTTAGDCAQLCFGDVCLASPHGAFSLYVDNVLEKSLVHVRADGFRPVWVPVGVSSSDGCRVLDIELSEKGGVLKGRLLLPDAGAAHRIRIILCKDYRSDEEDRNDERRWDPLAVAADPDGRFSCNCLDYCRYRVTFDIDYARGARYHITRFFTPDETDMVVDAVREHEGR
jgi:hypothetical protein